MYLCSLLLCFFRVSRPMYTNYDLSMLIMGLCQPSQANSFCNGFLPIIETNTSRTVCRDRGQSKFNPDKLVFQPISDIR